MTTEDFNFTLPEALIAQHRIEPYDHAKLLTLEKHTNKLTDTVFYKIPDFLTTNDVLVFNNTKVFKARLLGRKSSGKETELLLLERPLIEKKSYTCLIRGKAREGDTFLFTNGLIATVTTANTDGSKTVAFNKEGIELVNTIEAIASLPLPPYITESAGKDSYQTVYADNAKEGSIAAPTAGFHFTTSLLDTLKNKGVIMEYITLDVGIGTFRPVKTERIEDHDMHKEHYHIDQDVLIRLNEYKKEGRRIVAVGTTAVRTLEDSANQTNQLQKTDETTAIFIYPPYTFTFVDAMITNFHLPKSTLLMLVSAFAGKENIMEAYATAIEKKYRFFSFGDAMYIY